MLETPNPQVRSRAPLAIVVLAAGQGTRMRSRLPKVLHAVAGRPMVLHVLHVARSLRPSRLAVVLAPKMEAVAEAVAPATVAVQRRARGTADAVAAALPALEGCDGDVLVVYGDQPLIAAKTLRSLRAKLAGSDLAVLGFTPRDPSGYGRLIRDSGGHLVAVREHRDAAANERRIGLCNSGVMAVRAGVLRRLLPKVECDNAKKEFYLTDLVALARAEGLSCAVAEGSEAELMGVNSRAELAMAEAAMQERLRAAVLAGGATLVAPETVHLSFDTRLAPDVIVAPNVFFGPGVAIGEGSEILSFCHFERATVGRNAVVGPFARLRPGAVIRDGAHIGNFVEIKASVIGRGAKASHLSYIGDSTVGEETNIGAGTITCNYDGFGKYRTRIGRRVFIGSNTALIAPVSVGDFAVIGAGSVVTQNVAKDALVVARAKEKQFKGAAKRYRAKKKAAISKQKAVRATTAVRGRASKKAPRAGLKGRPSAAPK
jgi:bifunctional UDP-N-acetylglucosamine pyrophosphorylase/glucosamine-1-phosphate N-acetyltransferase